MSDYHYNGVLCPLCYRRWGVTMPDLPLSICPSHLNEENIARLRSGHVDWAVVFEALEAHRIEVSPEAAARMQVLAVRRRLTGGHIGTATTAS